jgi:hypothetical protein
MVNYTVFGKSNFKNAILTILLFLIAGIFYTRYFQELG